MKNSPAAKFWESTVSAISTMAKIGIGLKCPFCGEVKVRSIGAGILEVSCGTRIAITPHACGLNCVTQSGHTVGGSTIDERYPYKLYDCKA